MNKTETTADWEEISDALPDGIIKDLKAGQVLRFNYEGSRIEKKVMKLNKKSGKCWVKDVSMFRPEDVEIVDKEPKS